MSNLDYRIFYERNLPHYQPEGATLFVTIRLVNSLPVQIIQQLQKEKDEIESRLSKIADTKERASCTYDEQRRYFSKFDAFLDRAIDGPTWLQDTRIAQLLVTSLHYRDEHAFHLDAFSILPNHAHLVFKPILKQGNQYHSLPQILHSLKLHTALEANKILARKGQFWQHESYDHVVRDEAEWQRIVQYVVYNPVKAGLVKEWQDWPWTYCRYSL